MAVSSLRINQMVVDQLALGERRILSLVVAVRRSLLKSEVFKGDLSGTVEAALRRLIAAKRVIEVGGVYSLASSARH